MKIEQLRKRHKVLSEFLNGEPKIKDNIFKWISLCINLFTEVGVNNEIIKRFIDTFIIQPDNSSLLTLGLDDNPLRIGPFERMSHNSFMYKIKSDIFGSPVAQDIMFIQIAFSNALQIIEQKEFEKLPVPIYLIESLDKKYNHISSSLKLINKAYENKDGDGITKNSITLLDSILSLEPSLKDCNLSLKLRKALTDKVIQEKFGIHKDFIVALDNSRIIRNYKSVHKEVPINFDIPFLTASTFAYLVVTFLELVIIKGDLING